MRLILKNFKKLVVQHTGLFLLLFISIAFSVFGVLFLSGLVLTRNKWYGCVGGLAAGCLLLFMSTRYTGQVISLERPGL